MSSRPIVYPQNPAPSPRRREGFALLITITLLAFLVLLLVSLAALTRVETQVANNNQQLAEARQNALMALNVALGELQRAAGPDQRTTAFAALGEGTTAIATANVADNGLGPVSNGTRYWTGVWGNKSPPETLFTAAPQPVLLHWLVSGNENGHTITAAADGHITAPTAAAVVTFTPAQPVTLADGSALSASANATTDLRVNNLPATLLFGSNSVGANIGAFVAAPLVSITSSETPGLAGPARIGRYAWWVGDEGVKAKYNLPDPYIANNTPDNGTTVASRDSRYRLLAAQRNGIERMTEFGGANYAVAATAATDPLYLGVGKTVTSAGISLTSPGVSSANLKKHAHDLTTHSHGVLADSQFGGLRRDLTFHLDPQSGDTFLDGRNILPDGTTPVSSPSAYPASKYPALPSLYSETTANGGLGYTTLNLSPRLGPKWDQLKSFYRLAYDQPADLAVQPAVDLSTDPVKVQAAITPVLLSLRTLFATSAGPKIDTSIIVTLGNPYTRRLTAPRGLNIKFSLHPGRYDGTQYLGEDLGLICNFVDPSSASPRNITSVFNYLGPRMTVDHLNGQPAPSHQLAYTPNPSGHYPIFHRYYPILKYLPPAAGAPSDPPGAPPGILDNVVFQIPPGILSLAPGEAKAYKIDPAGSLPNETIGGISNTVVALQEMDSSIPLTYYSAPCDPYYLNPAFDTTNAGQLGADGFFLSCLSRTGDSAGSNSGKWDVTLTVPGNPASVLQQNSAVGTISQDTLTSSDIPSNKIPNWIFTTAKTKISGIKLDRSFRIQVKNLATYQEYNLRASFQPKGVYYPAAGQTNVNSYYEYVNSNFIHWSNADAFTEVFDPFASTQVAWGVGGLGEAQNSPAITSNGKAVLSDMPTLFAPDEIPLMSLGQLQHADLTANDEALAADNQPLQAVGNSVYNRLVERTLSVSAPGDNLRSIYFSSTVDNSTTALGDSPVYTGFVPDLPKRTQIRRYDISYLLNTALWDSAFFSTVRPAPGADLTSAPKPANRRLVYTGEETPTLGQLRGSETSPLIPDPAALGPGENGRVPAAHLLNNGAFNINSTSVEAWTAVLSGLRGLGANGSAAAPTITPFARSIRQPGAMQSTLPSTAYFPDATYTGYRALTDTQVTALATAIVAQVRARGPFLSLAQFVNRVLTPAKAAGDPVADTGLAGPLQQAVIRSGLNANLNIAALSLITTGSPLFAYPENNFLPLGATSGHSIYAGTPGWLTQADILQSIGPSLAARSDTFVIRTYGEVIDPVNSPAAPAAPVITARAWCEAVVQRIPDYVDSSIRPTVGPAQAGIQNQTFGRRFRVVSFRWLSPNDI